jgi:ribosome-associated toxin RatA of RatAB toxin-antitoxin module
MNGTLRSNSRTARATVPLHLLLLVATLLTPAVLSAAEAPLTVTERRGTYEVHAVFRVPQPPAAVLDVLTRYEEIPTFMPQIRSSIVVEREAGRTVVEQEAVTRFLAFSRRVHLLLEISSGPNTLAFRDLCGQSFTRYEGQWHVLSRDDGSEVRYTLVATPKFDAPEALVTRVMRRDSTRMMQQLRNRMAAEHP